MCSRFSIQLNTVQSTLRGPIVLRKAKNKALALWQTVPAANGGGAYFPDRGVRGVQRARRVSEVEVCPSLAQQPSNPVTCLTVISEARQLRAYLKSNASPHDRAPVRL